MASGIARTSKNLMQRFPVSGDKEGLLRQDSPPREFSSGFNPFSEDIEDRKKASLAISILIIIVFVSIFGISDILNGRANEGFVVVTAAASLALGLVFLYTLTNPLIAFRFCGTVVTLTLIYILYVGGGEGTAFLWFFFYPCAAFVIFGEREGMAWIGVSLLIVAVIMFTPVGTYEYSPVVAARFFLSYLAVSILSYFLEWARARNAAQLESEQAALDHSLYEMRHLNQTKDRLLSVLAHDLKNPFNTLIGMSEMLIDNVREGKLNNVEEFARQIHFVSTETYDLLVNILEWTRYQTGILKPRMEAIRIERLIQETVDFHVTVIAEKKIEVAVECDPQAELRGDRGMVHSILRNLFSNALKFTPQGGHISILARTEAMPDGDGREQFRIEFRDTGIGISPEDQASIFDPEKSLSREGTHQESGSGMGLILCSEFVRLHGGTIDVESQPNQGTTFTVLLPQPAK